MINLLENKPFTFEEKNSFNNGDWPCYYYKTLTGYIVFFVINKENDLLDFAVFDLQKNFISMIHQINLIIKDMESQDMFINTAIYIPYDHSLRTITK